jgi:hypothetical protein
MADNPTAIQSLAVSLLLNAMGEDPYNRTAEEYEAIKSRIPKNLKVVHHLVNERLGRFAATDEFRRSRFCRFRAGDKVIREEAYPMSISAETIRRGLILYGWRDEAKRQRA